jgi:hypothetical protein
MRVSTHRSEDIESDESAIRKGNGPFINSRMLHGCIFGRMDIE